MLAKHKKYLIKQLLILTFFISLYSILFSNISSLLIRVVADVVVVGGIIFSIDFLLNHFLKDSKLKEIKEDKNQKQYEMLNFLIGRFYLTSFFYLFFETLFFKQFSVFRFYSDKTEFGIAYYILSFLLIVVFHDIHFYFTHRLFHHSFLYKFHRPHHEVTNISGFSLASFHPVETLVLFSFYPIVGILIPLHYSVVLLSLYFTLFMDWNIHSGFILFPKLFKNSFYRKYINTTAHHQFHHEKEKGNYSLFFNYLDRIFKTDKFNEKDGL